MDKYVISLTSVNQKDTDLVGNKAANLGALFEADFSVLDGICITSNAFHLALDPHLKKIRTLLQKFDLQNLADAVVISSQIMAVLDQLKIPERILVELDRQLPTIAEPTTPLAIRSSATAEDTKEVSFAGHYQSVIGVSGKSSIHAAILEVWRSFFNPESLIARAQIGCLEQTDSMAVLILPTIEAECAGVALSVDPIQMDVNRIIVTATWGLGMGIVDGSVPADTAWIRRDGGTEGFEIEEHHVVEKTVAVRLSPNGKLEQMPVEPELRRVACLPDSWLIRIAQFCVAAEVFFGCPQDIEWAISNGELLILQSRPITSLPEKLKRSYQFPITWKNQEEKHQAWIHYPYWRYVLKPLEIDYAFDRASASKDASYFVGGDRSWTVKIVNGRAYTSWVPLDMPPGIRRIRQLALKDLHTRLHQQKMTTWDYWGPEIEQATQRLRAFDPETATGHQIAIHLENARGTFHRHWSMHGSRLWISSQPLYDAIAAITGQNSLSVRETADRILEGEDNPSTRLIDWLYKLAQIARKNSEVESLVTNPSKNVLEVLRRIPHAVEFLEQYDHFLVEYGACSGLGYGHDATIILPTWLEQPELVMRLIASYLNSEIESPQSIRKRVQTERENKINQILESCNDQTLVTTFMQELDFARRQAAIMEIHNFYIDQMMNGQLRHAILYAADQLVKQGTLVSQDDIFWLHFDEIVTALRATDTLSFAEEITVRQEMHSTWEKYIAPALIGIPESKLPMRPSKQPKISRDTQLDGSEIQGVGASPGIYKGRARIIDNSVHLPVINPGEILVTQNIGPRWTPIFPTLGGIVLDGGSVGQHHAIIAREYGIPAVVGTGNATRKIPDGAWVTIDGTKGTAKID
jgi:pyruvate,water dikinase